MKNSQQIKTSYQIVDKWEKSSAYKFQTRAEARETFKVLGGAVAGYELQQVNTIVLVKTIR